ncbi:X-linked retinitis pigmentosa GTPase regulator [Cephus cinctus]|uniref:X-linked retinitis pigmentosa GTPase regulator n=1 Tax=Cephus cinctus TaxID=211228 RepID=A0AAJ7C2H3_CEPCN|nr:X-linked retinitis pigmentosa GTPase regulator [Cephus cinctus]
MGLPDIDNIPETGAVFTIGRSRFADNVASHFFIRRDPVLDVTCGDEHSAVVCESGRLFVFGSNDWGQLGLGHKNHVSKPSCVKILKPEKVTHVACGRAHTLICTGGQKIFACGSDQEGQLGRGTMTTGDSSSSPVLVHDCGSAGPRIVQLAAGSHHSMILTSDGDVMAWGSNLEGQLGLPGISGLVNKPTKVQIPEPAKQISAGYYHSAFLTETGLLYVCGESESGKIGIVVNFSTQVAPKLLQLPMPIVDVACGGHHTLVLTDTGTVHCFGSNASGQLGMGIDVTEVQTPKLLPKDSLQGETISKIACGESHSAIITESGKLFTCGDGRHGKLGLEENENNVHELTWANKYQELFITNVSCGGCHTILVGRRRELDNDESDSLQMDPLIARNNSLPPLKVSHGRLQYEVTQSKKIEVDNKMSTSNPLPSTTEMVNNDNISIKDPMNNSEKPEVAKKMSEYIEEHNDTKVSETSIIKENVEKLDEDNNVSNDNDVSNEQRTISDVSERSSNSDKEVIEGSKQTKSITDNEIISGKTILSPLPVPPPKPPRTKIGSADSALSEKTSSSTTTHLQPELVTTPVKEISSSTIKTPETSVMKNETVDEVKENCEQKSANSRGANSANSENVTEETLGVDGEKNKLDIGNENNKDIGAEKDKDNRDTELKVEATDDTDVVPSPLAKTGGKMAKLFRNKKQLEAENGTKGSNVTNAKSKSKTCSVI